MVAQRYDRRDCLRLCGVAAATPLSLALQNERRPWSLPEKPNIVLIMADDLGYECLGCYGSTSYATPNLDRLAASGVRFTRAYATPLCTPSRVQLMTGQYPFRNGWRTGIWELPRDKQVLDPDAVNFAHVLKAAGYATAVAGKWQLARFDDHPDHVTRCGFDEHCVWTWNFGAGTPPPYWSPGIWENGKLVEGLMEPQFPTLQYFENLVGHRAAKRVFGPDYYNNYMIDFIRRHASEPFFAYYPMVLPHLPGVATPDSDAPPGILETILHDMEAMTARHGDDQKLFVGMVAYMDKLVGRIIRTIDDLNIREKTMIIFTADNGTASQITSRIGNTEIVGGKGQMNDASSHVPLIVNWQGAGGSGLICDDLVDFSDVFPTLVEVAGATLPAGYVVDGRSTLDQIRGLGGKPRDWILIELDGKAAVLGRHWKLLNDGELFDVTKDPLEKSPVTAMHDTAESAQARKELDSVLASFGLKSA